MQGPVDCGLPGFSAGGFSRQEYWSILANTGCPTLLEHYISCCPSHQLPWIPGAARTPETQTAAPPPQLALTGAEPSPPGQFRSKPQWMTHMQRWKYNHKWNPGAVWIRKKTQNHPTTCISCRLNPHDQLGRLYVYGINKRTLRVPTKENALVLIAVDIGGKNPQDKDQIRICAVPTTDSEVNTVLEGILGRRGGLWLPAREKTLTPVTQEKHLLFLYFDLFCRLFWIFSPFPLLL